MPERLIVAVSMTGVVLVGCDSENAAPASSVAALAASASGAQDGPSDLGGNRAVPIPDPHSARALLDRFQAAGYPATFEGLRDALQSENDEHIILALRVARLGKDERIRPLIAPIEFHPDRDVRLAVVTYLASIGDTNAIDVLRNVADQKWTKQILESPPAEQVQLVETVRTLATLGDEGFCYELSVILAKGSWIARDAAAAALGFFHGLEEASLEQAWIFALDVLATSIDHEDERVRAHAPVFATGLLASAMRQSTTTTAIVETFDQVRDRADAAKLDDLRAQLELAIDHLATCEIVEPPNPAPGIEDDPRDLATETAVQIVKYLEKGEVKEIGEILDLESGVFDGLPADQWLEQLELEFPPSEDERKLYANESVSASRRQPGLVRVKLNIDMYNRLSGTWESVIWEIDNQWWGYGWHLTSIERFVEYELVRRAGEEFGAILALPDDLVGPFEPLLAMFQAIDEGSYDDLDRILAEDGQFRGMGKQNLIQGFSLEEPHRSEEQLVIIPVVYAIDGRTAELVDGRIQLVALNEGRHLPMRITYRFRSILRDGRWVLQYWQDIDRS